MQEGEFQEEECLPGGIGSASVQWPRWQHRASVQVLDPSHETEDFRVAALAGNFGQLSLSIFFQLFILLQTFQTNAKI